MPGVSQHLYEAPPIPNFFYRNIIINGNFDIWQRGTSFISPPGATYSADRWRISQNVDNNSTVAQTTTVPNTNSQFSISIGTNALGGAGSFTALIQKIENYQLLLGKQLKLTLQAIVDPALTGTVQVFDGTNTTLLGNLTADNNWHFYNYQFKLSSSATALWVEFFVNRGGVAANHFANFSQVQLTQGVARWEYMPPLPYDEFVRCQRYFQRFNPNSVNQSPIGMGFTTFTNAAEIYLKMIVPLRATPVLTVVSTLTINDSTTGQAVTAISVNAASNLQTIQFDVTVGGGGLVANRPCVLLARTASSDLFMDAEM